MLKKEEERQLIRHFGLVYEDYPKGKIIEGESPDFVLKPNRKYSIGIELTKLFLFQEVNKPLQHFYEEILAETQNILRLKKQFPFSATFRFSPTLDPNDDEVFHDIVATLVTNLQDRLIDKSSGHYFQLKINKKKLPKGVESVELVHHPSDKVHRWLVPKDKVNQADFIANINELLEKKAKKLEQYQQKVLNEYWLLITVEDLKLMTNFNISNCLERFTFESSFDKVLLFDYFGRRVYDLI